jgi:hypothetical protein
MGRQLQAAGAAMLTMITAAYATAAPEPARSRDQLWWLVPVAPALRRNSFYRAAACVS